MSYALREVARLSLALHSEFKGLLECGLPVPYFMFRGVDRIAVVLDKTEEGESGVHFHGIATCSSPWVCPVCSPALGSRRGEALGRTLSHFAAAGFHIAHATLTVRHTRGQPLKDVFAALSSAWRVMTKNRAFRPHWSGLGYARGVELTFGRNGWHPHIHLALVIPPERDPYALEEALWEAWSGAVVAVGWDPSDRAAFSYRVSRSDADVTEIGKYVAKAGSWGVGPETASGALKTSGSGMTPFQLLGAAWDAYLADPERMGSWFGGVEASLHRAALEEGGGSLILQEYCRAASRTAKRLHITPEEAAWRWLEYAEVTKGRRALTTSRALGLLFQQALAELEAEGKKAVPHEILWLTNVAYLRLLRTARLAYFIHLAEELGSLRQACEVMGLVEGKDYVLPPSQAPPDGAVDSITIHVA